MKLCVEELIDTKRLVAFISISLLLGIDGGNMACEAIVARAVVFFFPPPLYSFTEEKGCSLWNTGIGRVKRDLLALAVTSTLLRCNSSICFMIYLLCFVGPGSIMYPSSKSDF